MSKQIKNKYDTAKKMYPILKNYPYSIIETLDKNSPYYLEHFPPEEVGSLENPRPKNLPIGEYGLQIFKDVRPEDIAGDIISHHIINKDKYLSKKYEEFKKLISKEDMLNRYNYHKNNLGEKRDFNNWSERTGYPELLRGYVFNQFDKKTKDNLYTLEQKKVLDSIKNYITQNEQTQQAFNQGGYGVAGKFTPDTGVSAAKEKGNFKGLGYKGEAKEAPAETKTFQESVDMSSGGDNNKIAKPLTSAPFQEGQFDKYKRVDPEVYTNLKFQQTDKNQPLGFLGEPTGQTLKERQEEVKRIKRFSGLSETVEMAKARVKNSVFNRLKELSKTTVEYNPETKVSEIVSGTNKLFQDPKNITDVQKSMEYFNIKAPMIQAVIESGFLINAPNDFDNFIFNEKTGEYDLGRNRFVGNLDENDPNQVKAIHNFYTQATGAKTVEELDIDNPESSWFWCSAFIHDILTKVNAKPLETSNSFDRIRARKYIDYGTKIADLKKDGSIDLSKIKSGDILIIGDPNTFLKGGPEEVGAITHLTIFVGDDIEGAFDVSSKYSDKRLLGLGGNQSSSKSLAEINVKPFSVNEIIGVRRIDKVTPKMINQLKQDNPQYKGFVESATPPAQRPKGFSLNPGVVEKTKEPMGRPKFNKGGTTMEQQMGGLLRKPIKAHQGTVVDGKIVYEGGDTSSDNIVSPKESAPVATPATSITPPAVSTPALAPTPTPPPASATTTQQLVQQPVQQPAPQPPTPPPPQPVAQPVETPEQAEQVASTFVPENIKQAEQTAPKQATPIQAVNSVYAADGSKVPERTDAQKEEFAKNHLRMIKEKHPKMYEAMLRNKANVNFSNNPRVDALIKKDRERFQERLQQAIATQQTPKRLPQPYRPTQEEQKEIMDLDRLVRDTPEFKLIQKEAREFGNIQQKELGSYQRKIGEVARQFGPQSQEFKNAVESYQFQNRLFAKQYAPTIQRLNKLQSDLNNSDAIKNLREARDRIFKRNKIQENVPSQFNKGGMSMEQQMSLFEEGGMKDDGLDRDPVSGNDIPPGSLAKEVRDDIPAQLSDGEYVVPADVVQYFGVKFFEDIRAEAKRGLAEMEATGRIGGEPVEVDMTMIAFGQRDKDKKEKKAQGGVVGFDNGGVSSDMQQIEKSRTFNPADYAVPGFTPSSPIYQTGQGQPQSQQNKTTMTYYHGQTGEAKVVTFINGVVSPATDLKFTQPPWSLNKPTQTQQQVSSSRDDKDRKDPPPGWGADPEQFDFTDWTEDNWNKEINSLVTPKGVGKHGFFRAAGVANAYAAIELAKAKGIDTTEMEKKVKLAYDDLPTYGKVIVTGANKLLKLGGEGAYAKTIAFTNETYANLGSGKTTTTIDGKVEKEPKIFIKGSPSRKPSREEKERASIQQKEVIDRVKRDKDKSYRGQSAIDKKVKQKEEADDPFERTGEKRAKGGLIQRPKRKNKK